MNIYEIKDDILMLQDMLLEDPENECIQDTLEALKGELDVKAEGYVMVMKNMQSQVDAYKAEIGRMTDRKRTIENSIERMKTALFEAMKDTGTEKVNGELFTISLRNNAPQLPKDLDYKQVPVQYLVEQEPTIDRTNLLKAVKDGEVKCIQLVRSQSLSIR